MARTRILIVDDNIQLADTMKTGLVQTGQYDVHVINNPNSAVSAALDFRPDLVILDVIMPEKDGGTVAAEIREVPALKNIPVIFATSIVGRNEAAAIGGHSGEEPVLPKPVSIQELTACIEKTLRNT